MIRCMCVSAYRKGGKKLVFCLQRNGGLLLAFSWHFVSCGLVVLDARELLICEHAHSFSGFVLSFLTGAASSLFLLNVHYLWLLRTFFLNWDFFFLQGSSGLPTSSPFSVQSCCSWEGFASPPAVSTRAKEISSWELESFLLLQVKTSNSKAYSVIYLWFIWFIYLFDLFIYLSIYK